MNQKITKVIIDSAEVLTRNEVVDGQARQFRHQVAYLDKGGRFPDSCKITLRNGAHPYPPGEYETAQDLEINNFGELRVKLDLNLQPIAAKAPAARAAG